MHVLMVLALFFPFSGFAQEKNMVDNEMKFQEIDNRANAHVRHARAKSCGRC